MNQVADGKGEIVHPENSPTRRARTSKVLAATVLLTMVGGTATAAAPAHAARPGASPDVRGVWRVQGDSTVLSIGHGTLRTYQTTAVSCLPGDTARRTGGGAAGTVTYEGDENTYQVRPGKGGARATLHYEGSTGDRTLRRVTELPQRCGESAPHGKRATFDVFWQTFAENYPFFQAKNIDWRAVRDRYRPRIHEGMSDAQLFAVLREMISPLYDAHVSLRAGDTGNFGQGRPGTEIPSAALDQRARSHIERIDLGGERLRPFAGGRIGYAQLPAGQGYLRISGFGGYTDKGDDYTADSAALDEALTEAVRSGPRGLVLDLRINGGGSDALALQVAGRLADRPYFAYAKRVRDDPADPAHFTRPQPVHVHPALGRQRYPGPLAVLTGGETYSAGETLTQALMDRPAPTVRIGRNTQGVFSDVLERRLPNGWTFGLPNEEFRTATGETFDGAGIPPHHQTGLFTEELAQGTHDSAFARALVELARHPGRSQPS
ncbi:S41 family peptidase [Streptomyces sp. NPDC059009]|uniref:S41 family peptidase n=1 Tax=Streptomyces sp. NPDC059009 TaxID=3346694 RepID=UPI003692ED9C